MLALALSETRAAAGETLHGRVDRQDESARVVVELMRVEHSPAGAASYHVVATELESDGSFTLEIPDAAPPGITSGECSLHYVLRATAGRDEARQALDVVSERGVIRPTLPEQLELGERAALSERLVASFPGRRMHVELSDAALRGGGHVEGRVHLDRAPAGGRLQASVRCIESWRVSPRPGRLVLMSRANAIPLWRQRVCFEEWLELESLDDAHWRGFSFTLPDRLPPAVEARSIAWRYEVEARRSVRLRPDDRAMLTPLGSVEVLASARPRADRPTRPRARSSAR
jgi:hypothetical protein